MEQKPVLIVENCLNGLKINENASEKKSDKIILEGIFTEFDVRNRNDRIYTSDRFLPHLEELKNRMNSFGIVYGEFDHPDVFDTALSRVSHTIESITFNQSDNRIDGSIRLLNTHYGKEAQSLVLDGCPIFVSSRAAGVTESNGTVTIKKLFTYDAVADPGFASTKMSVKVMNESLGFNESVNFRIFDMSDESKINELYEMNKSNEFATQKQMHEYSLHISSEIEKVKEQITKNIKEGIEPEKLDALSEYYESLMENQSKLTKYLDYLADTIQIVVNENNELKEKTNKLIEHNDYLAENLEKTIGYSNYLAEQIDKNIDYSEYIAESLDKSIDFSEYIAENLDKSIKYSEYLAESLDKSIDYSEYLAENTEFNINNIEALSEYVDNSIKYSEYVAEQVDNTIAYSEYLAEHVDNNIQFSDYIAEHVDNNIAYSEYIAENLSDTQAYSKYIAESLDKTIDVVNGDKLNEDVETGEQRISDLKVANVDKYYDDEEDDFDSTTDQDLPEEFNDIEEDETEIDDTIETEIETEIEPIEDTNNIETEPESEIDIETEIDTIPEESQEETIEQDILPGKSVEFEVDGVEKTGTVLSYNPQDGFAVVKLDQITEEDGEESQVENEEELEVQVHESKITVLGDPIFEQEKSIKDTINQLILEAKKRKASEENEPHFLLFLSENNKSIWKELSVEDKEKVNLVINESKYTSEKDVLNIIREALSKPSKTEEEVLIDAIPSELIDTWNGLNDTVKKSVLSQAKFYPNLIKSLSKMESFWHSRELEQYSSNPKKVLLNENKNTINDSKLSETQIDRFINTFRNLS